jgi:triacylglycerol lipase
MLTPVVQALPSRTICLTKSDACTPILLLISLPPTNSQTAKHLPRIYNALHRLGFQTGAFSQLTTTYMKTVFNPTVKNDPSVSYASLSLQFPSKLKVVRYYSYGAYCHPPPRYSVWHYPYKVILEKEGPNDGLVSVESAHWGTYEGTLVGVTHLGIINWVNRIEYAVGQLLGRKRKFNALAFYCEIIGEFC